MRTSYGFLLVTNPLLPLKVQVGEPYPPIVRLVGSCPFLPQLDRDSCWPPFLFCPVKNLLKQNWIPILAASEWGVWTDECATCTEMVLFNVLCHFALARHSMPFTLYTGGSTSVTSKHDSIAPIGVRASDGLNFYRNLYCLIASYTTVAVA